jgi:hypothetical protein
VSIQDLERRILAARERQAGRSGDFPITVENNGIGPETTLPRNDGRKDVTVPSLSAPAARDERGRIGDDHVMPDNAPTEPLKVGTMTLYKSGVKGFERAFSRNISDWELHLEDGRIEHEPNAILQLLHAEGRRVKAGK